MGYPGHRRRECTGLLFLDSSGIGYLDIDAGANEFLNSYHERLSRTTWIPSKRLPLKQGRQYVRLS